MQHSNRRSFIKAGAAIGAYGLLGGCMTANTSSPTSGSADTILANGRIATQNERRHRPVPGNQGWSRARDRRYIDCNVISHQRNAGDRAQRPYP